MTYGPFGMYDAQGSFTTDGQQQSDQGSNVLPYWGTNEKAKLYDEDYDVYYGYANEKDGDDIENETRAESFVSNIRKVIKPSSNKPSATAKTAAAKRPLPRPTKNIASRSASIAGNTVNASFQTAAIAGATTAVAAAAVNDINTATLAARHAQEQQSLAAEAQQQAASSRQAADTAAQRANDLRSAAAIAAASPGAHDSAAMLRESEEAAVLAQQLNRQAQQADAHAQSLQQNADQATRDAQALAEQAKSTVTHAVLSAPSAFPLATSVLNSSTHDIIPQSPAQLAEHNDVVAAQQVANEASQNAVQQQAAAQDAIQQAAELQQAAHSASATATAQQLVAQQAVQDAAAKQIAATQTAIQTLVTQSSVVLPQQPVTKVLPPPQPVANVLPPPQPVANVLPPPQPVASSHSSYAPPSTTKPAGPHTVKVALIGDTGEEKVRVGTHYNGANRWHSNVIQGQPQNVFTLNSTMYSVFELTFPEPPEDVMLAVEFTNDGMSKKRKDKNVRMKQSLIIDGVEKWDGRRFADTQTFIQRGDVMRRNWLEAGTLAWGTTYFINLMNDISEMKVEVYKQCGYKGYKWTLPVGRYSLADVSATGGLTTDISAVRLYNNAKAVLYKNDQLQGERVLVTKDVTCLPGPMASIIVYH